MPNLWRQFENLIVPPSPRAIGEVLVVYDNGEYLVELLPSGVNMRVLGRKSGENNIGDRVIIENSEIIDNAPTGGAVVELLV